MSEQKPLEALKSGVSLDFWLTKHPICPHCGHECSIGKNDWFDICTEHDDRHEKTCPSCSLPFSIKVSVSHVFSTDEQGEAAA